MCVHPRPQGFYSGELSNIDDNVDVNDPRPCKAPCKGSIYPQMTGYDIDLLDKLAGLGGFTYSKVHVGKAEEIEAGEMSYTNRAKWLLGVEYVHVAALLRCCVAVLPRCRVAASICTRARTTRRAHSGWPQP